MPDITTTRIFVDGEKGITAAKMNDIVASSSIQPTFYTSKPVASTADATDTMLILKGGAYNQAPVSTFNAGLSTAAITSVRLRSYNSLGNPSFEIDQRNCGTEVALTANAETIAQDRWSSGQNGTVRASAQQLPGNVVVPGTSYYATQNFYRMKITTAKATPAVTDYLYVTQAVEGPMMRELMGDAHSLSLLVRSNVASLAFGVSLQDNNGSYTLAKLCTSGAANTWTLVSLPNLPVWTPSSTHFTLTPGTVGYSITITLMCGTTNIVSANNAWVSTTTAFAPIGIGNLAATLGNTFDIAFCQHEPGATCSTFMDKPFSQNLDECERYFFKTNSYFAKPGSADASGANATFWATTGSLAFGYGVFRKRMAYVPTVGIYNAVTGVYNSAYNTATGGSIALTGAGAIGEGAFLQLTGSGFSGQNMAVHYAADAGM